MKIGAKVVGHRRYLVFQMAEVGVPRELFRHPRPDRRAATTWLGPMLTRAVLPLHEGPQSACQTTLTRVTTPGGYSFLDTVLVPNQTAVTTRLLPSRHSP